MVRKNAHLIYFCTRFLLRLKNFLTFTKFTCVSRLVHSSRHVSCNAIKRQKQWELFSDKQ